MSKTPPPARRTPRLSLSIPAEKMPLLALVLAALVLLGCWLPWRGLQQLAPRQAQVQQDWQQVQQWGAQAQALRQQLAQSPPQALGAGGEMRQALVALLPPGMTLVPSAATNAATSAASGQHDTLQVQQVPPQVLAQTLEQLHQRLPLRYQQAQWQLEAGHVSGTVQVQWLP